MAGKIALFGLLEENVVIGADLPREEGLMELGGDFSGESGAAFFFRLFDLIKRAILPSIP